MFPTLLRIWGILSWSATVLAHGNLYNWVADGVSYSGYLWYENPHPITAAWSNHDDVRNTYVGYDGSMGGGDGPLPWSLNTKDIACTRGGKPGKISAVVRAGGTITFDWGVQWAHPGPFLTYLANCNGPCDIVDPNKLDFFKVHEVALLDKTIEFNLTYPGQPTWTYDRYGTWPGGNMIEDHTKIEIRIPETLSPGNYTVRHEAIAIHLAMFDQQIQSYPQCVNFIVTGDGTLSPKGVKATELYNPNEPGFNYDPLPRNVTEMPDYLVPGSKVWDGK